MKKWLEDTSIVCQLMYEWNPQKNCSWKKPVKIHCQSVLVQFPQMLLLDPHVCCWYVAQISTCWLLVLCAGYWLVFMLLLKFNQIYTSHIFSLNHILSCGSKTREVATKVSSVQRCFPYLWLCLKIMYPKMTHSVSSCSHISLFFNSHLGRQSPIFRSYVPRITWNSMKSD